MSAQNYEQSQHNGSNKKKRLIDKAAFKLQFKGRDHIGVLIWSRR